LSDHRIPAEQFVLRDRMLNKRIGVAYRIERLEVVVSNTQQQNAAVARVARAGRHEHALLLQPAQVRAMRVLMNQHFFERTAVSDNGDCVHEMNYCSAGPCCASARPRPYVTAASMMPTSVISSPLAHHGRVVISAFEAPTAKCAMVLMMNDAMTAGMPTVNKNGMIGMNPPMAVEVPAENVDFSGFGNVSSESPSSSWTSARRNCFGSFSRRPAIAAASSGD